MEPRGKVAIMLHQIGSLHDRVVEQVKGLEDAGFECRPDDGEAFTMSDLFSPAATVPDEEAMVHDEAATVHDKAAEVEPATEVHAEPEEPPAAEAINAAAGAGSSTGPWSPAQAATTYRTFLASVRVDSYPPQVRFAVQRALWHEYRGALKEAKKCLNEALRKGGHHALTEQLQQGAVREHLECLELPPEARESMPRRCNRCRKPAGQCAPSCLRREQERIQRKTAYLEA